MMVDLVDLVVTMGKSSAATETGLAAGATVQYVRVEAHVLACVRPGETVLVVYAKK